MTTDPVPSSVDQCRLVSTPSFTATARGDDGLPLIGGSLFDDHPIGTAAIPAAPHREAVAHDQRQVATLILNTSWLARLLRWRPRR